MKISFKQRFVAFKNDIRYEIMNPQNFKAAMQVFMIAMVVISLATVLVPLGFSAEAEEQVKNIAFTIYQTIAGVSTALAVVGESIAASLYFFSSNGKTVESASGWMKRIAIGWIFINAMGVVVSFISSLFSNEEYRWQG